MPTIKDVAKSAGVSVATVSRVLNHDSRVSPQTRDQVEQAIEQIGYMPNHLGRNLRTSETKRVLVLLPTLSNQFYSSIVKGIEQRARLAGYTVMVSATQSDLEIEQHYFEMLYTRSVDGVILLSSAQDAQTLSKTAARFPLVMCCEYTEGAEIPWVGIDNRQAAYDAVEHLARSGCRRIAMVGSAAIYSAQLRRQGYRDALHDSGLNWSPDYEAETDYSFQSGINACKHLMSLPEPPDAYFAISDVLATGIIRQLHEAGLEAGTDAAVFGFDDTRLAAMYIPSVSTIAQPRFTLGQRAMDLLLEKMVSLDVPNQFVTLNHRLVLRDTAK